jgi:hypothetical protein
MGTAMGHRDGDVPLPRGGANSEERGRGKQRAAQGQAEVKACCCIFRQQSRRKVLSLKNTSARKKDAEFQS